jgi:hypothetical protein
MISTAYQESEISVSPRFVPLSVLHYRSEAPANLFPRLEQQRLRSGALDQHRRSQSSKAQPDDADLHSASANSAGFPAMDSM